MQQFVRWYVIFPVLAGVSVGVPSSVAAPVAATAAGEAEGVRAQVWASACNFLLKITGFIQFSAIFRVYF